MLHHQRDHGPLAPGPGVQQAQRPARVVAGIVQQLLPARHLCAFWTGAVGHQRLQQPHRVGALAVADRLDVGVRCRVNGRGDRHPVGQVQIGADLQTARSNDRFGVGTSQHAQPIRQPRQLAGVAHLEQQLLRVVRAGGQHNMGGGEGVLLPAQQAAGALGVNLPQPIGSLLECGDGGHRMYLRSNRFRETKVILHQGVLSAVAAAGHTGSTFQTAGPGRSRATEVRVGNRLAWCFAAVGPKEHADRCRHERVAHAHVVGDFLDDAVGVGKGRVRDHTKHPLRLLVVRSQLGAPVGDVRPLPVVEERIRWHIKRVGVVQRATADAGTRQNHAVLQQVDALDAVAAQVGRPQELAQIPGGLGEILVGEAAAGLEHPDAVTLLGQPERGDTPPETRTDNQDVVIRFHRTSMDLPGGNNLASRPTASACLLAGPSVRLASHSTGRVDASGADGQSDLLEFLEVAVAGLCHRATQATDQVQCPEWVVGRAGEHLPQR